MPSPLHVNEIHIRATPERVWTAITDPEWTRRYLDGVAIESSLTPGSGVRYVRPDDSVEAEGLVEVIEPGRRLVMTWTSLHDATTAAEPPSRVEWSIEPADAEGAVTRVRVRHYDLGCSPATWARVGSAWRIALDGLKTLLETGSPLGPLLPADAAEPTESIEQSWQRGLAVAANNATWELLDGRSLDDDGALDLLGRAHAAAHHWRAATGPHSIEAARAAWLCARAHTVVGQGSTAIDLARSCTRLTAEAVEEASDFDQVYAIEATARATACLGQLDEAETLRAEAWERAAAIGDDEDRAIVEGDLAAEPWFGLAPARVDRR